jgi:broad specificity phosphatase PhoE
MKRFYIIRHGEKVRTPGNPPLSELGNLQAQKVAKHLQGFPISRIVASPILRTQQTAKHIADMLGLTYETNDLLKERVNWGDDTNQSFEDFLSMWTKASQERDWQPPVGDSSVSTGKRLEKVISDMLSNKDEHVVLVTHGGITTDFLRNAFKSKDLNQFISDFESTLDENIKECSITIVEADPNNLKLKLIELANIDHLYQI